MRNKVIGLIFALGMALPGFADEVFMNVEFADRNIVYRIDSENKEFIPVGQMFDTGRITDYFIDPIKNHRFIKVKDASGTEFIPSEAPIYRQVFDGPAAESDMGRQGNATCFDARNDVVKGENGKPVYRTQSVAFSAGTGVLKEEAFARKKLIDGECTEVTGKNWYEIPNGSWYQSYSSANTASGSTTYDVLYDRWEENNGSAIEEIWRGDSMSIAFSNSIGKIPHRRLQRAKVDGALEKVADGELKNILEAEYKSTFFMEPGNKPLIRNGGCYTWSGNNAGSFSINGKINEITPIYESKDADKRFVCVGTAITGFYKYYVLGTDILRQWLDKFGIASENAECSNVTSVDLPKVLKTMIFVYSKPENKIYRFIVDEANEPVVGMPKQIKVNFDVADFVISKKGELYLVERVQKLSLPTTDNLNGIEKETCIVNTDTKPDTEGIDMEDDKARQEAHKKRSLLMCDAICNEILSRAYYIHFYKLAFDEEEPKKLDYEIFLGKEYFSLKFDLKHISLARTEADVEVLLEESKKPGNSVGAITDNVPGYPSELKMPLNYHLAVFNTNK